MALLDDCNNKTPHFGRDVHKTIFDHLEAIDARGKADVMHRMDLRIIESRT